MTNINTTYIKSYSEHLDNIEIREEGVVFNIQKFSIHDGPGIRTTVFFKGCPLNCRWCANPESKMRDIQYILDLEENDEVINKSVYSIDLDKVNYNDKGEIILDEDFRKYTGLNSDFIKNCKVSQEGKIMNADDIVDICLQDKMFYEESGGGVTVSGGEPTSQPGFLINILKKLQDKGIQTAIETSAYCNEEVFKEIMQYLDLVIFDVKHWNNDKHKSKTDVSNSLILRNISNVVRSGQNYLARIPVIPGFNDSINDAKQFAKLFKEIGIEEVQILPFHQFGEKKYENLGLDYDYEGVDSLKEYEVSDFLNTLNENGINAYI